MNQFLPKRHIPAMIFTKSPLFTLIALLTFAACASDDEPFAPVSDGAIVFGARPAESLPGTRADEIVAEMPQTIGVYAYGSNPIVGKVFENQKVLSSASKEYTDAPFAWEYWDGTDPSKQLSQWPYTVSTTGSEQVLWKQQKYRFFAYAPWQATGISVSETSYDGFTTFEWKGIPGVSGTDYLVAKAIVEVDNSGATRQTSELVQFELQHLMARLRFFFRMSPDYRKLRKIKVEKLTITAAGNVKSATVTFTSGASPSLSHDILSGPMAESDAVELTHQGTGDFFVEPAEKDANGDIVWPANAADQPFASAYVYPQLGFGEMTIRVNYSTYDSQELETRKAEVTNTIKFNPVWTLAAGRYYDIRLTIVPDYLYVLSDNDQTMDGYVVIKETSGGGSND